MSFFRRLFNRYNSNSIAKTSQMLNEDYFWKIIDDSLSKTNDQDEQKEYFIKYLKTLTPAEIVGFRLRTDKLLYDTYNSEMWCAGYIMNGGCSDDSFQYFRNWVISRGKGVYYKAKQNPDSLIAEINEDTEFYDFEDFWYVALDAFKNKTGKDLYDFIDEEKFKFGEGNYLNFDFTWEEENPDSMRAICPKLFAKMWK
ncbi:MAG: DUF4240 domain-containing protein [Sphingobacteriia bacterium]|nr:DUF4240 domain-containing protein [Sphingobacteriia bacterium]MBN8835633.1 DUF4240 domain-containing protein [Sphingobacteriia bacterium]